MNIKELLEKAFDAGWDCSLSHNNGEKNGYFDFDEFYKNEIKALNIPVVVKSLPTEEEINLEANEHSDITGIICPDECWVVAKNDSFKDAANFIIEKIK